ncbi:MAG TPA: lipoate--protein ligase family protein [Candidatus Acidoferrum sp.]|jgi:lipoate-protein ligase A|nr:lipoate--protein ligase family protein [Candidatus Acidoferrum sp.]
MKFLDLTLPSPAENLACDEALLGWREEQGGDDLLRFWESPEPFVVVGYANKIMAEVNVANCEAKNVPIFRRCSGGGTVLQGPSCLNYALILRMEKNPYLASISAANKFIMEHNREAIQSAAGHAPSIQGHTDLAFGARKFSGNSQRRHKSYLLFHGTFLLNFNLPLVGEFLSFPSRQPDYRDSRSHGDFLMNLDLPAEAIKGALKKEWKADLPLEDPPLERISKLAREKYATPEWNLKFFHL